MSSASQHVGFPTGGDVFDPLVLLAKARVVDLVEKRRLDRDEGEFLLRALLDLEADGVELFGDARPADAGFYVDVSAYLEARVGATSIRALDLAPEAFAVEGTSPSRASVEHAVLKLINHPEVST
jgi:hypothetical protein